MNTTLELSAQQLRRAADIKDKIVSLQNELNRILGGSTNGTSAPRPRRKRRMSATARAKISAAARARWARYHAAKK